MASAVKPRANQRKHLTEAEKRARDAAEESVTPDRGDGVNLKKPKGLNGAAATHWNEIIARCEDVLLIDDLDREMLAVYCQMLARRDKLNRLCEKLLTEATKDSKEKKPESADKLAATDKLDSLMGKIAALERNLMTYADKLGFTPQSRARLAQKRATAAAEATPEGDYFGD